MTVRRAIIEVLYSDTEAEEVEEILGEVHYFTVGLTRFLEDGSVVTGYSDLDPEDEEDDAELIKDVFG